MKNKVFVASPTPMFNWGLISGLLRPKYGENVKIECSQIDSFEGLETFINQNKNLGPVFITEGEYEYGEEIIKKLKESNLKFGMFRKSPETKKWGIEIFNNVPALVSVSR